MLQEAFTIRISKFDFTQLSQTFQKQGLAHTLAHVMEKENQRNKVCYLRRRKSSLRKKATLKIKNNAKLPLPAEANW